MTELLLHVGSLVTFNSHIHRLIGRTARTSIVADEYAKFQSIPSPVNPSDISSEKFNRLLKVITKLRDSIAWCLTD